LRTYTMLPPV